MGRRHGLRRPLPERVSLMGSSRGQRRIGATAARTAGVLLALVSLVFGPSAPAKRKEKPAADQTAAAEKEKVTGASDPESGTSSAAESAPAPARSVAPAEPAASQAE